MLSEKPRKWGGSRPGAGRKMMKPGFKKKPKTFSLTSDAVNALQDLQEFLGLETQSAVIEFLVLKSHRELIPQGVKEHQKELF